MAEENTMQTNVETVIIDSVEQETTDDTSVVEQCGLILLGNSGVGKSFLANILLGYEAFAHKFSSSSVTHLTEFKEIEIGDLPLTVFNIPGLIEAQQERIDLNKIEIDKAFALRPNSIVMFVFGQQGGRMCDEDITAFNAINKAYPFHPESLVLVVNGLPKNRPSNYEGTTLVVLRKLLNGVDVNNHNLCFVDHINASDLNERQYLKEKLLQLVVECTPAEHQKKQEIETLVDKLKQEEKEIQKLQVQMEAEHANYKKEIEESQRIFSDTMAVHRTEIESLQRAIQRQDELFAEQQRRYEEEIRRNEQELQRRRREAEEAERYYEKLQKDKEIAQQQLQAAEAERKRTQGVLQILIAQSQAAPPRKKKKHWWKKIF